MEDFQGKTIVVTGASSGLGRSCAERLGREGANLVLVGRKANEIEAVAASCGGAPMVGDLTDKAFVASVVSEVRSRSGTAHGWVLAAGAHALLPLMMEGADKLIALWRSNVLTSLGLVAAAFKGRVVAPRGSIVFFSSVVTRAGGAGMVSYASTKGALEGAVRSLSLEVSSQGIRVNAIAPGVVDTPMSEAYLSKLPPENAERVRTSHPLGVGRPEDVSGPVAFLLSDDARWITGSVLVVDGGLSAA